MNIHSKEQLRGIVSVKQNLSELLADDAVAEKKRPDEKTPLSGRVVGMDSEDPAEQ